ncbi:MAG: L-threonylcarbamoyladenylate synthase [Rikenellaceae bacterium]|nr:L-threonylcarbamoyladenylate synthase [Rikenellaceae bacterium]MCL2692558.1 L-threonylcarbamoyladenylate synthase [Rikenellaceae bacterium]
MLVKIYPENPSEKAVMHVVEVLRADGVIVFPTDGVYAYGCSIRSAKGFERLRTIRQKAEAKFAIMCPDLSCISDYARVDTPTFKLLKRNLPGPFTFVLNASSRVPDKVLGRRRTIGVRIDANPIAQAILRELGSPMIISSVKEHDGEEEYLVDPELIAERWGRTVDMVIDGGRGNTVPTTLVDMSHGEAEILRQGGGELEE